MEDNETVTEPEDAFDEKNYTRVMLIQSMRLYDVMLSMLAVMDPEKARVIS